MQHYKSLLSVSGSVTNNRSFDIVRLKTCVFVQLVMHYVIKSINFFILGGF